MILSFAALLVAPRPVRAADAAEAAAARIEALQKQVAEQTRRLEALKRSMAAEEARLDTVRRALGEEALAAQRGGAGPAEPVSQAPERASSTPEIAPIFDQPGVLTPGEKWILEPSLQYAYSSTNRVALVGCTIIPALTIGVIDVREVKRNTLTATLTARYGLSNRLELEARLPYAYGFDTSVGRELLNDVDSAITTAFDATGHDIGDVDCTARYQFNDGGMDKAFYVGSLRVKTRTGRDPFEVETLTKPARC